ncbi:DUF4932 domain-containing protein [Winogradskyella maritima]
MEDIAIELLYPKVTIAKEYSDSYKIEIPKMYELMYIACSLTETFQNDSNLISKRVPKYLNDVKSHFSKFKNHDLIQVLEDKLKPNPYSQIQPTIRFFSLNYEIDDTNTLVHNEVFHVNKLLIKLFKDKLFYYAEYEDLIEDFAKATDFSKFYKEHQSYYQKLITDFDQLCDIKVSWNFLENRFTESYNSYRIIFSPLTGGFHNTLPGLKDKETGLQQTWLFVSAPPNIEIDTLTKDELEIIKSKFTRELFTEMNHNYVNPLSDTFSKSIESSIMDYSDWNKQKRGYNSKISTFNEYMTWGVFSIFAKETYSEKNRDTIISIQEKFMVENRKFIHFKAFNRELIRLSNNINDDDLHFQNIYSDILKWMRKYPNPEN